MPIRLKQLLQTSATILIGFVLIAIIVEWGFRFYLSTVQGDSERGLYIPDPEIGHRYQPGFNGVHERKGIFHVNIRTDAAGFRIGDVAPPTGSDPVIGIFGDSFVFGWGQPFQATVGAKLEAELDGIRVVNRAVSGYTSKDAYTVWQRRHGAEKYRAVLFGYFLGNDIRESLMSHDLLVLGGRLHQRYSALRAWEGYYDPGAGTVTFVRDNPARSARAALPRLIDHWLSAQELIRLTGRYPMTAAPLSITSYETYLLRTYPPELQRAFERTIDVLREWNTACRPENTPFLVVLCPGRPQLNVNGFEKRYRDLGADPAHFSPDEPQHRISEALRALDIPVLDLTPAFREADQSGAKLFPDGEAHWSAEGHALAADQIAQYLRQNRLLDAPGERSPAATPPPPT